MLRYTIVIGDSKEMAEVKSATIGLIVTSPPYFQMRGEMSYNSYEDYLEQMKEHIKEIWRVLRYGRVAVINVDDYKHEGVKYPVVADWTKMMMEVGFNYEDVIIWHKNQAMAHMPSSKRTGMFIQTGFPLHYKPSITHEPILIFRKGEMDYSQFSAYNRRVNKVANPLKYKDYFNSVWQFATASGRNHPAEFPLELPYHIILFYSLNKDVVLDPFAGSGTTGEACWQLNRSCTLYELDEKYLDIIKKRCHYGEQKIGEKVEHGVIEKEVL